MRVTRINGMGSFGVVVDDFEWDQPEAYKELRDINLKTLLTVVHGYGQDNFHYLVKNSSQYVTRRPNRFSLKYNVKNPWPFMTVHEKEMVRIYKNILLGDEAPGWHRVTGKLNEKGEMLGNFGDTELNWHVDEFLSHDFSPSVTLYGAEAMTESSTSFFQTVDWYNEQTESFKSELDELICLCDYDPTRLFPTGRTGDIKLVTVTNNNGDDFRAPLVITSPGGYKGLRFGNFVSGFANIPQKDSDRIKSILEKQFLHSNLEYDFWWPNDRGDMALWDNSIVMHRRKLTKKYQDYDKLCERLSQRICYRFSGDYTGYENYNCYSQPEFYEKRQKTIDKILTGSWEN